MALPLLLVRRSYPGLDLQRLGASYDVRIVDEPLVPLLLAGADPVAIWTFREPIDRAVLGCAPSLRVVASYGAGTDTIDRNALDERGIALVTAAGANAEAVADHVFALLLAVRHRIVEGDATVRSGGWDDRTEASLLGGDVHGTTIGIVGLGAIGSAVARRARGFGMRVLATPRGRAETGVERLPLEELLPLADALTLHCPLTDATRGLIGARELALLRPGAVLVNTARGAVVDEAALVAALVEGRLAGAGLDVFAREPHVPATLRALSNVVLTPHVADATVGAQRAMTRACVEGLLAHAP